MQLSILRRVLLIFVWARLAFCDGPIYNGPRPDLLLPEPDPAAIASKLAPGQIAQWRSDVGNSGYFNVTAPEQVEFAWKLPGLNRGTHSAAKSTPIIVDSTVIAAGDAGIVWRLDLSGNTIWSAAQQGHSNWGFHGTPCIAHGLVVIGAYDGSLYAYDWDTGHVVWARKLGQSIGSSPVCTQDFAYITVEFWKPKLAGGICAVELPGGAVKWCNYEMTDHPHSTAGMDLGAGLAFAGCNNNRFYSFDLVTGHTRQRFDTGGPIKGPILVWKGLAVFGSWDKKIYGMDTTTLLPKWTVLMERKGMSGACVDPATDTIYIGSHDGNLRAISLLGEVLWMFKTEGAGSIGILSSPVVTRNLILFGAGNGKVHALTKGGTLLWALHWGRTGVVTSSIAVTESHMAFASRSSQDNCSSPNCLVTSGSLHMLRAKPGASGPHPARSQDEL